MPVAFLPGAFRPVNQETAGLRHPSRHSPLYRTTESHERKHKHLNLNAGTAAWYPNSSPLLWRGSEQEAMQLDALPAQLSPPWKVILLSDGSVTRHLQLMTGMAVSVDCLEMRNIGFGSKGLPQGTDSISRPLLQRQVLLRTPKASPNEGLGTALVYAASWWNATHVDEYLQDRNAPIWVSLSKGRLELYRDIQEVCYGNSTFLQRSFQQPGPFWGRQYLFWHNGQPLTLIYEVFSTSLEAYLGPCSGLQESSGLNLKQPTYSESLPYK